MSCFVQYAPYALADGAVWDDARREALGDTVLDTLAEYAPGIRERVLHRQVLTPLDLEREFGLSEGNIFHGELTPGSALLHAPGARLGAPRDADPPPLPLRLLGPPRRRHHGRPRPQRRPSHPPRAEVELPASLPAQLRRAPRRRLAVSSTSRRGRRSNSSTDRRRSRRHAHRFHLRSARPPRPSSPACSCWRRRAPFPRPGRRRSTTRTIAHVLDRTGFGARAEDVTRVRELGLDRYLDEQLHPERLSDADVRARLAGFQTLALDSSTIAERYYAPLLRERRANKKDAAGRPPDRHDAADARPRHGSGRARAPPRAAPRTAAW